MSDVETVTNAAAFDEATTSSGLVIAKFHTKSCVICRRLDPGLKQLIERTPELNRVVSVDAEEISALAERYEIRSVPTLLLLKDGRELARCNGFQTTTLLRDWISPHLNT